jgi:nucleoside-diphosphate-sugar epimerase
VTAPLVSLVIGFPGEPARRVAAELARRGRTVRVLTPPALEADAAAFAGDLPGEAHPVLGDLDHIDLGLPGNEYLALAKELESVVLAEPPAPALPEEAAPSGRDTMREVLELACAAPGLAHAVILSHVDVAGDFPGSFAERDLDVGQRFTVPSQRNRFLAERLCRRFSERLPLTVVRSGWLVGSGPGLAQVYTLILSAGDDLAKWADRRLVLAGVDGLSRLLGAVVDCPPPPGGRVLHAVDPAFPRVEDLVERLRVAARDLAPASFDLAAGARRSLQRSPAHERWSAPEFFGRQPKARIESTWSTRFAEAHGLPSVALTPTGSDELIEHTIEEIVGLR